jgi:hypothetical protein
VTDQQRNHRTKAPQETVFHPAVWAVIKIVCSHFRNIALAASTLIILANLGLLGCATSGPEQFSGAHIALPDDEIVLRTGLPSEQVNEARKLYLLKCSKCHRFYNPAAYEEAEWRDWMRKMSNKARLTPDEESLLDTYLQAFRTPRSN